ncbi:molybdopterin biosynthesis protein [Halobaculum sp. MBLA0147]|uniref:molybdopterin biosynthesis protein n=1 Tax=Halobaculum sp. MBLA0147 TaxID=3079934 RepID=UPI003526868C
MSDRREFRDLAEPETLRETIASLDLSGTPERVPLAEARGRVLAERVDADRDVPGFDRASMDGYAVRAADTFGADEAAPAVLRQVGTVHAGSEPDATVESGTCVEVSTGAVLPPGADAVVIVEETDEVPAHRLPDEGGADAHGASGGDDEASSGDGGVAGDDEASSGDEGVAGDGEASSGDEGVAGDDEASGDGTAVAVRSAVAPGENVMFAGADVAAGARALGPGTELTPREIGLLSALGVDEVPVRGQPTVGIVSTGDELVRPGEPLDDARGEIYDVNSYTIAAGVAEAGGEPRLYPHAGDDYEEMERLLIEASEECDLVLSSGSTSASAVDVIYRVIEDRGELLLHGVAVKPGKPTLVGRIGDGAYVGLPGYPVSALTIFRTFVAPAIREAAGLPAPATATVTGEMAVEERYEGGRRRLVPVGLVTDGDGETLVYPVDKGSGATTSLVDADGVVPVDPDTAFLAAGETVEVELFSPSVRPPTLFGVGEDDPALSRLLDRLDRPRYLPEGSRRGLRELRAGVPDVAVTAGPLDREPPGVELGGWRREWGLIVPPGNPADVTGVADLVDRELRFVNRDGDSGLRTSFGNAVADLADERDTVRRALVASIDGFDRAVRAHESPARRVLAGDADVGLGLRATADRLDAGFVSVGTQRVRLWAATDRQSKPGVDRLRAVLADSDAILAALPGYGLDAT